MQAVLTIVLSFILTGVIGAWLAQGWQQRNWLRQQQFLSREKRYISLRDVVTELTKASGTRMYRMRRLLAATAGASEEDFRDSLAEYRKSLAEWNESLPSFFVRLTMYGDWSFTYRLEQYVQKSFVSAGRRIEAAVRARSGEVRFSVQAQREIGASLDGLQGQLNELHRDLVRRVESAQRETYFGWKLPYSSLNLSNYSTTELVKALFITDVQGHSVVRTF